MFHAGGHKGVTSRGMSSGLGRHYPHFLSHLDWKSPLRCGILFCTFSGILLVIGVILTWLGVHDVFGESVPITGPILLAVGGLMLILALRQFYVAHVRKKAHDKAVAKSLKRPHKVYSRRLSLLYNVIINSIVTGELSILIFNKELTENTLAAITEHDDEHDFNDADGDLNTNKDDEEDPGGRGNGDSCEKPPLISGGYYHSDGVNSSCVDPLNMGGYIWPQSPLQHPFYSMAMMLYKDPTLTYGTHISAPRITETYSTGPVVATGTDMYQVRDNKCVEQRLGASSVLSSQQPVTALLETLSTTMHQQTQYTCPLPASAAGSRQECSRVFPADYLPPNQQRRNVTHVNINPGISGLANPTAFMMLRTLELQETI